MSKLDQTVFVAGHRGMVGSAIVRHLKSKGYTKIITCDRNNLDLKNQLSVKNFFQLNKPDQVYLAAAKVGGIYANNSFPAEFIYENLMIEANVIHEAWMAGVQRLLFLGSSCIYPRLAEQPMSEDALLTGVLEPTNEPYAISKIAGIKLCESYNRQYGTDYRSVMPTNLYGPGDNYHSENSHVIPALIKRFHEAKINSLASVSIWGTGSPRREFLYVDDMAAASVHVMELEKSLYSEFTDPMQSHINIGTGKDVTIRELAETISQIIGYAGQINFDSDKPDGAPRKLLNVAKISQMGWSAKTSFRDGIELAYKDFCLK